MAFSVFANQKWPNKSIFKVVQVTFATLLAIVSRKYWLQLDKLIVTSMPKIDIGEQQQWKQFQLWKNNEQSVVW